MINRKFFCRILKQFALKVKVVLFQTNCGKQNNIDGSFKQVVGNKMQSQEVSNRLWGTNCNRRKFQTNCRKQKAIAGSFKQVARNKIQSKKVSNSLHEIKCVVSLVKSIVNLVVKFILFLTQRSPRNARNTQLKTASSKMIKRFLYN